MTTIIGRTKKFTWSRVVTWYRANEFEAQMYLVIAGAILFSIIGALYGLAHPQ